MSDTVHSMMKHIDVSQWRAEIQDEFSHEVERLQHLPSLSEVRWVVDWHWILGAAIAVAACFLSNYGLNLQKLSHLENLYYDPLTRQRPTPPHMHVSMMKRPRWVIGITCVVVGSLADFAALGFAAQSLVATLGSLTLVSNVIIAPMLLNERVTREDYHATTLIVAGCALSVAFGQHESEIYTLKALMALYTHARFFIYSFIVGAVMLAMFAGIVLIERKYASNHTFQYQYSNRVRRLHRFLYPALAGTMGAQSVLFAKCSAELIKTTIAKRGTMFTHVGTYLIILGLLVTIFLQIRWLNDGLERFDVVYVVPVFQTFWICVSVAAGLVFFDELEDFSFLQALFFPLGIVLNITGVYLLSQRGSGMHGDESSQTSKLVSSPVEEPSSEDEAPLLVGRQQQEDKQRRSSSIGSDETFLGPPVVAFMADLNVNAPMLDRLAHEQQVDLERSHAHLEGARATAAPPGDYDSLEKYDEEEGAPAGGGDDVGRGDEGPDVDLAEDALDLGDGDAAEGGEEESGDVSAPAVKVGREGGLN